MRVLFLRLLRVLFLRRIRVLFLRLLCVLFLRRIRVFFLFRRNGILQASDALHEFEIIFQNEYIRLCRKAERAGGGLSGSCGSPCESW